MCPQNELVLLPKTNRCVAPPRMIQPPPKGTVARDDVRSADLQVGMPG